MTKSDKVANLLAEFSQALDQAHTEATDAYMASDTSELDNAIDTLRDVLRGIEDQESTLDTLKDTLEDLKEKFEIIEAAMGEVDQTVDPEAENKPPYTAEDYNTLYSEINVNVTTITEFTLFSYRKSNPELFWRVVSHILVVNPGHLTYRLAKYIMENNVVSFR
jgi:hypothetical protein